MNSEENPEIELAQAAPEDTSASFEGDVVGTIEGLVWHDVLGVDIVSVRTVVGPVVVPVAQDEWRGGGIVAITYDEGQVRRGPLLGELQQLTPSEGVELVSDHYSLNLGGPPPGTDPSPVPPWWDPENP